ncbi:la-related protein 6B isoform X1 [Cynara cardunculus var. scolymus]|uniref:la-related protein 6B isoform X1 n=1 Tax=Cynara cardunculus var. scolymus TaxID=59895 RepID=UPI000D628F2F|nr:la-related protein 6B isoform X1 [Cynara cardunculus var. scolymus]
MAQEPSSSTSQTLDDDLHQPPPNSTDSNNPSLTRNVSSSRLNAKAPEFVPRTTTTAASPSSSSATTTTTTTVTSRVDLSQPRLVISPPPTSPGIIHVYPSPNSPFHAPIPTHVPVSVPVQNHHPHHHHHHVPLQFHHHQHHNPNHQRPFNGATGFLDHKDVSVQVPRGDPDSKDGLTDEATQKILNQVEYYFSDINLATTDHLMRFINKDPEGYVPISVVVSFKKIKALVSSNAQLASILRSSAKLVVSEDGKKVKRQHPLTESDMEELQSRIIVAENLPEDHCHQNLMKVFSTVGSVKTIRTCQPQTSNGGTSSSSRAAKADGMLFSNKLHAFVEYESIELAEKAVLELNKEGNWRNGLRVRLLRRPPQGKPAQGRGKKTGQEDEVVNKEDDTSTSEQHQLNEKHLDDTYQQSEVQSNENVQGEDHSNEKEGGHKKLRNRGRGKGRGRPQYNHHNNRGTHMVTPPSTNCVNTEHPVIGKQPPGPRMPDGTRGFSMGRGKAVAVPDDSSVS